MSDPDLASAQGKRLLLLSEVFPPAKGGSGRWFAELYPRLQRHQIHLLVGEHPRQDEFDGRLTSVCIRRADLSMPFRGMSRISSVRRYLQLRSLVSQYVRDQGIQEIHAARPLSEGLVARLVRLTRKIPYTCFVHGEDVSVAKTSRELTVVTDWVLRGARRLIANSSFTRSLLVEEWKMPAAKVLLLNPGVDIEYFTPAEDVGSVRARLGWTGRRVLLTVGRLQTRKGQDVAIQAVSQLSKSHPELLYAIAGDGADRDRLTSLAHELHIADHVQFLGEVNDRELLDCYRGCDYFALPNRTIAGDVEGFGMVLLEAQACGRPVIAGRSGGTVDALDENVTGVLLDCRGPDALAQTLKDWLSNPEVPERMGAAARSFVVDRYSWHSLANQADVLFLDSDLSTTSLVNGRAHG